MKPRPLTHDAVCVACGTALTRGSRALILPAGIHCPDCLDPAPAPAPRDRARVRPRYAEFDDLDD